MPRKGIRYRLHKASGRAVVQYRPFFGDTPHYLAGKFESPEMYAEWESLLARYNGEQGASPAPAKTPIDATTVNGLCAAYLRHVAGKRHADTIFNIKRAVGFLTKHPLAKREVESFGPRALIDVRQSMEDSGMMCRNTINGHVRKLKAVFRWGVTRELVRAETHAALSLVEPLKEGETTAAERQQVVATNWPAVERILPYLSPTVAAMVQIQYLAGLRGDDVTGLQRNQIDFSESEWVYRRPKHKTSKKGKKKVICFGPRAQEILKPYLANRDEYVFNPGRALAEIAARRAASRKTKKYGAAKSAKPKPRKTRPRYTTRKYFRAIRYGFEKLGRQLGLPEREKDQPLVEWLAPTNIEYWHDHQLRHARAMETQAVFGIEGVRAQTGNSISAAQIYAQQSLELAKRIARETG